VELSNLLLLLSTSCFSLSSSDAISLSLLHNSLQTEGIAIRRRDQGSHCLSYNQQQRKYLQLMAIAPPRPSIRGKSNIALLPLLRVRRVPPERCSNQRKEPVWLTSGKKHSQTAPGGQSLPSVGRRLSFYTPAYRVYVKAKFLKTTLAAVRSKSFDSERLKAAINTRRKSSYHELYLHYWFGRCLTKFHFIQP
jgi:hypothetical protein